MRGAAELQAALLRDTLGKIKAVRALASPYLFITGRGTTECPHCTVLRQRGADLGARLDDAFRRLLHRHSHAIIVGTDSPMLRPSSLRAALGELRAVDAVIGPCPDGGYYLMGVRRFERGLLEGVRWGSAFALRDTLRNLIAHRFSCSLLEPLEDVDRPADFRRLAGLLSRQASLRRRCQAVWRFIRENRSTQQIQASSARRG